MAPPVPAASVVLARAPGSHELLLVERAPELRFFGGFHAFPGGKLDEADHALPIVQAGELRALPFLAGAARELFEETGILLARRSDGSFPNETGNWTPQRQAILENRLTFSAFLASLDLRVHATDFHAFGALTTPNFSPVRFETHFFTATLPPGQECLIWSGELVGGFWATPQRILADWSLGLHRISPPTVAFLEQVRDLPIEQLPVQATPFLRELAEGAIPPILFGFGVQLIPLQTRGLPPSNHTNAYLVGSDQLYLIDPGAEAPEEQARLFAVLDRRLRQGGRLQAVVLTHHHPDHVGAAEAVARRYVVPILAHASTLRLLRLPADLVREINEGNRLQLGTHASGNPWYLEALFTPGHASGHLVFFEPQQRFLFAGDLVSMLSSVVIAPPDGDLALYLRSLERLREMNVGLLLPGHGTPTIHCEQVLKETLEHRLRREEQLCAALRAIGPVTIAALTAQLYSKLTEPLAQLARLQTRAGLRKLAQEGKVVRQGGAASSETDEECLWVAV